MIDYVSQAGDGIFCMRICQAGQQKEDPCNVKDDTAGCTKTMGVTFRPGWTFTDKTAANSSAKSINFPELPPASTKPPSVVPGASNAPVKNETSTNSGIEKQLVYTGLSTLASFFALFM